MQLLMASGPAEEKLLAQNKENQRLIGVGVEKIEKLLSTEREKALFNDVKTLRTPYLDSRAEMKKLLAVGHRDAAITMANDDMIPKLMTYRASWNRFLAAQNDALKAAVAEGAARYRSTRALALSLIVLAALAATVIGAVVTRRITTPILDLTRTVQHVSTERDYSLRAVRSTSDEMGLLADGFNDMLGQIQKQNVALQEAHDGLEEKVKARTTWNRRTPCSGPRSSRPRSASPTSGPTDASSGSIKGSARSWATRARSCSRGRSRRSRILRTSRPTSRTSAGSWRESSRRTRWTSATSGRTERRPGSR